ncbi:MAG: hypothetical protein COB30_011680 [Ectothiorhodospiraceae bacterium]|nr:hypothetical protein [Ectothiorhodospiraceae bacterium]
MKSIICIAVPVLLLLVGNVQAGTISCRGKVSVLMAEHVSCKDSDNKKQFAFKLEGMETWKCSGSDTASSLLLAAKISDKSLSVYISDGNGATCSTHSAYLKSSYIILSN